MAKVRRSQILLIALAGLVWGAAIPENASADEVDALARGTEIRDLVLQAKRIVFLGDSITYGGKYVADFEAWLLTQDRAQLPLVINVGLSSETVSGLSEEGHAGGRFPRPHLKERLQRVLQQTKPDLVFACYGINCGIYKPFDKVRFERYQNGIGELEKAVKLQDARLVLLTPPLFDDQRSKNTFSYNGVLDHYSDWLLSKREQGALVIDLHSPMAREVARRRQVDPEFTFQRDAVHPDAAGHWFMAQQLIQACQDPASAKAESPQAMLALHGIPKESLDIVTKRMALLRNAYLNAAGHSRPGVAAGLPVSEARKQADELTARLQSLQKTR